MMFRRAKEDNMSKKINAGDTLTVGDLTDDYLGAVIEVETMVGITYRFTLGSVDSDGRSKRWLWASQVKVGSFFLDASVTVITPPPVVQPDEPTILGQCIRIEGDDDDLQAVVADPGSDMSIVNHEAIWCSWEEVLDSAGDRQIIVSDPPRWPDETPVVPERIEVGEWPDDDTHLRGYKWIDHYGDVWAWEDRDNRKSGWNWNPYLLPPINPVFGPWTRGERVK